MKSILFSQERSMKHDLINIYKSNEGKILKLKFYFNFIKYFDIH